MEQVFSRTGKQIFEDLKKLEKEINELYDAAEMVKKEIGAYSAAYHLLNEQYKDKRTEMQNQEKRSYSYKVYELGTPKDFGGIYPGGTK